MGFKNEGVSASSHGGVVWNNMILNLIKKGRIAGCVLFACGEKQKYEMVSWLSFGANFFLRAMASTF